MDDPLRRCRCWDRLAGVPGRLRFRQGTRCPTLGCAGAADSFRGLQTYRVGDRFRILGRMGPERYGLAVHAQDAKLGQDVVLLYLEGHHGPEADAEASALIEAQVAFKRSVPLLDHGRDPRGDRLFLVRAFVSGARPLSRVLAARGQPLSVPEALWVARITLDSLADLHAQGQAFGELDHADSLLLESRADSVHLRLANHGLSRLAPSQAPAAAAESSGPSRIAFLSPQGLDGHPPGSREDLYALGVLLYYLLSAQVPWRGARSALEQIRQKLTPGSATPLTHAVPGVDPHLAAAIEQAYADDPARRYSSAAAFAAALPAG